MSQDLSASPVPPAGSPADYPDLLAAVRERVRATYEITRTLPKELAGQLPPPEQIAALLEGIEP